jgi:sugar phosphate permease
VSSRHKEPHLRRLLVMSSLVLAGEAVFSLPFHVARFFRPTVLRVFGLTNSQLGGAQAVYGVLAMVAYLPGGPLADRFPARKLMAASLLVTAASGLYFATLPGLGGLQLLFGIWGVSTILLFWAPMIRATRQWGGAAQQGLAFGVLDGGRGLVAAALASLAVLLLGLLFPADPTTATDAERARALATVILVYTGVTGSIGLLIWFVVPESPEMAARGRRRPVMTDVLAVLRLPPLWLQTMVIVCAYVGYKGLDNYSLYAVDSYGMDEVAGARLSALAAWVRPPAAVLAGLVGDRVRSSRASAGCFSLMLVCYVVLALHTPAVGATGLLYADVLVTCAGVFGLRGLYFALFEEATIPPSLTGCATGLVSLLGYTPDIFVSPTAGWLLDRSPGLAGHQHFFWFLAVFAALGLTASLLFGAVAPGGSREHHDG